MKQVLVLHYILSAWVVDGDDDELFTAVARGGDS
jgi:hypothetical protein